MGNIFGRFFEVRKKIGERGLRVFARTMLKSFLAVLLLFESKILGFDTENSVTLMKRRRRFKFYGDSELKNINSIIINIGRQTKDESFVKLIGS